MNGAAPDLAPDIATLTLADAARLCAEVYEDKIDLATAADDLGLDVVRLFNWEGQGLQAAHLVGDSYQLILVRGTQPFEDPKDLLHDLNAVLVDFDLALPRPPGVKVHAGFQAHVEPHVSALLTAALGYRHLPLYVAGHSLGAAAAAIIGRMLLRSVVSVAAIYRIAPPAVGNAAFEAMTDDAEFCEDISVERCADLVCRRPESLALFGYRRGRTRLYFDRKARPHLNPGWWFRLRDRTAARFASGRPLWVASLHHRVRGYATLLADNPIERFLAR